MFYLASIIFVSFKILISLRNTYFLQRFLPWKKHNEDRLHVHFYLGACESYIDIYTLQQIPRLLIIVEKTIFTKFTISSFQKICMKSYCAPMHDGRIKMENETGGRRLGFTMRLMAREE